MLRNTVDGRRVTHVYSGQKGKCCCGCAGKHYYSSDAVKGEAKRRGYSLDAEDVSDRMVSRVCNTIERFAPGDREMDNDYQCVTVGNRWYIAYYGEPDLVTVSAEEVLAAS